jgi:hypothetical protein
MSTTCTPPAPACAATASPFHSQKYQTIQPMTPKPTSVTII